MGEGGVVVGKGGVGEVGGWVVTVGLDIILAIVSKGEIFGVGFFLPFSVAVLLL